MEAAAIQASDELTRAWKKITAVCFAVLHKYVLRSIVSSASPLLGQCTRFGVFLRVRGVVAEGIYGSTTRSLIRRVRHFQFAFCFSLPPRKAPDTSSPRYPLTGVQGSDAWEEIPRYAAGATHTARGDRGDRCNGNVYLRTSEGTLLNIG